MKPSPLLSLFLSILAILPTLAQTPPSFDQNYVWVTVYKTPTPDGAVPTSEKIETITYYDGLGRPIQAIDYKAGGNGQDIITPIVYDEMGRQAKTYLPYAEQSGNSLQYRDNAMLISNLENYYSIEYPGDIGAAPNPYSKKIFDASPLNRVLEQGAPGESWKVDPLNNTDHTIKYRYQTNQTVEVRRFSVSHPGGDTEKTKLEYEGYYLPNQLYKTVVKDENWQPGQQHEKDHTTETFTNKLGRVVLKRAYDKNIRHDTYYVYDDYGNLTYVIPPLASAQIIKGEWVIATGSVNHPWIDLVEVDAEFAEDYNRRLAEYENEDILNADLENEYGGQGGFSVNTTEGSEDISLSIVFSANQPLPLKTGMLVSLEEFGEFPDTELGRIEGEGYLYHFYIHDNAIMVEGEGELSAINKNFGSTALAYSRNHPWTAYTEVNPDFARQYEEQLEAYPNDQWLTTNIPNEYNGHGGLNISIDEQDMVTVSFTHSSGTPFPLKEGLSIPLETERRIEDGELGTISGPGYEYTFSIQENSLLIEGGGAVSSLNDVFIKVKQPSPYVSIPVVEGLCYIYHHDSRNRVVEKKIPGKGWEHIVYNNLNWPILIQDANLRAEGKWLYNKYDALGRVISTGLYTNSATTQNAMRALVENYYQTYPSRKEWEEKQNPFYTNLSYPITNLEMLTINFYDYYSFITPDDFRLVDGTNVFDDQVSYNVQGLPTGSRVKVLGQNEWILTVNQYDKKGRIIYTASNNSYLNTTDKVKYDLDFTGNVLATQSTHTYGSKAPIVVEDVYTYDHMQRLLTQVQTINGGTPELIVSNTYDELGKLESKKVGGTVAANPENSTGLQNIDYAYNIRGWLKEINDPGSTTSILGNDLFAFSLNYTSGDMYNGNISTAYWKTANDNLLRKYMYDYDALNRIVNADYKSNGLIIWGGDMAIGLEEYDLRGVSYDKNGNILSLKRIGLHFNAQGVPQSIDIIDSLSYFYKPLSNTLMKVDDTAYQEGFENGTDAGDDYGYDLNGNLTSDANKKITSIVYNHLNLPTEIKFNNSDTQKITYSYTADGIKVRKVVNDNSNTSTTDYTGNFIYENGQLRMFFQPEGYVEPVDPNDYSQGFKYIYQYKDHLGNIRLSYSDVDNNGLINNTLFADGFESRQGWTSEGAPYGQAISAYDNSQMHSGNYSGRLDRTNTNTNVYVHNDKWARINNAQSTQYTFSGWVYSNGPQPELFLFMNEDGESGYYTQVDYVETNVKNQWVYLEKTVSVPANIDKLNLRVGFQYGSVGQSVWYDDVKIEMTGAGNGEILDEKNYYPFGLEHKGYNNVVNGVENNYQTYQSKEIEKELGLGWHDFGARRFQSDIARWTTIDPLSEKFYPWSPYNAMLDNPAKYIDPTGMAPEDWVLGKNDNIYWDDNANDQSTTQAGDTYLGKELTFTFNSYIDGESWDGPMGDLPAGDKLTSTITLSASENEAGQLTGINATSSVKIGDTPMGTANDYFPGLGSDQNNFMYSQSSLDGTLSTFNLNFEQHASVSPIEALGLDIMGYDVVNVAQKLRLGYSGGNLSVTAGTDVFPSATLSVDGNQLFKYNQPSFKATHGRNTVFSDESPTRVKTEPRRPEPSFYVRYKN
jgi:RHS repeat-associated protein